MNDSARSPGLKPPDGFVLRPGYLSRSDQERLAAAVGGIVRAAPFFEPRMPRTGKPFSVRMTNAGALGWVSDKEKGYRYERTHPVTGVSWPAIPEIALEAWQALTGYPHPPEACLINYYEGPKAKMGLHVDADEADKAAPVLSISLGDTALFRLGGPTRRGATSSMRLASGDVVVLGGAARHCYHGVDRILPGSSTLLPKALFPAGGRLNLTLRRVT